MSDENERSVASAGSVADDPVAWAVLADGEVRALCQSQAASAELKRRVIARMAVIDGRPSQSDGAEAEVQVAPLYRQPQPTLTDAEREAVQEVAWLFGTAKAHAEWQALAAVLRGLLERMQ